MEHFAFTILCTVTLITALPLSSVTCLQQYVIETGDTLLNWSVEDRNLLLLLCTFMIELVIGFAAKLISLHLGTHLLSKYTFWFPASLPLLQLFFLLWEELFLNHTLLGKFFFYLLLFCKEHVCMCPQSLQSCLTLCDLMDCSPPGSSVHGDSPARIIECIAISTARGSSQPKDGTHVSYVSCIGRQVLYH